MGCTRDCVLLAGACPKEKSAPDPVAGADVSAGLAEKLNDGVGPVDPVEDTAVELLVAEKEKVLLPADVEVAVDALAWPKENDGAEAELEESAEAPALKLNAGVGPVEAVEDFSELTPPKEKAAEPSDLVVDGSETGLAAPREKVGSGRVSAVEAFVSAVFGRPPNENAGAELAAAVAAAVAVATVGNARLGPVAVDAGAVVLSPKPPKLGTGSGLAVSVFSLLSPPVRLNVTVLFLVEAPSDVLDASAVDVGEEIVPIENGVAVVEVTDDNVAESVVVVVAVLSLSVVVLLLRPNASPPLPES